VRSSGSPSRCTDQDLTRLCTYFGGSVRGVESLRGPVALLAAPRAWRGVRYLAGPLVAALALLAASCGGPSEDERYAERVCAATLVPAGQMLDLLEKAHIARATPGEEGFSQLVGFIRAGQSIARKLEGDLRALPPPNTAAGMEASKTLVHDLPGLALGTLAAKERSTRELGRNMTLVADIHALNDLEFVLASAYGSITDFPLVWTHVPQFEGPFENAASCKKVAALGARR
jgi:hypothetical protein